MAAYRVGTWAAGAVAGIGVAYVVALVAGFRQVGFAAPIRDPVLAVMEALTLLSAVALVVAMAVLCQHASHGAGATPERRLAGLLALAFTLVFAGLTSAVHFVGLTAARQRGGFDLAWPSVPYAVELLAWDWFLGLALLTGAGAVGNAGEERSIRRGFLLAGGLALVGTIGPLVGDLRLQRIGIVGYAVALPVVCWRLMRLFRTYARRRTA